MSSLSWAIGGPILAFVAFIIIALIIQINSVVIYDNFSDNEKYRFTSYAPAEINFRNNSPLNIEQLNPIIIGKISILDNPEVDCKVSGLGGFKPCSERSIDLGKIPSGDSGKLHFVIKPDGTDFSLTATPYLHFFIDIPLKSKTWTCTNVEGDQYLCESQ